MDCSNIAERFMDYPIPCCSCRSGGVVWEGFGTSRGPQKPIQEIGAVEPAVKSRGHTLSLVGDKDAGEPQKSRSDARKTSEFEEKAEENATEPFGGKTQTESENYPEEVQRKKGEETILEA